MDRDAWLGREELREDRIDPALVARWCATLDRAVPSGEGAPQGVHWCLGLPDAPSAALGPDGHPRRSADAGGFLPPLPDLPRRMWAASAIEFHAPLRAGQGVARRSVLTGLTEKHGASGRLVFAEIAHETSADGALAVCEVQSVVYRAAAPAGAPVQPPPPGDGAFDPAPWAAHRVVVPDEALLFRYSALTFNSHRIHYDRPYATGVEGYRGLVVHGPLTATLLLDLARRELGEQGLRRFAFRGVSPAICGEALHLVLRAAADGYELGAFAGDGRQVMSATAA